MLSLSWVKAWERSLGVWLSSPRHSDSQVYVMLQMEMGLWTVPRSVFGQFTCVKLSHPWCADSGQRVIECVYVCDKSVEMVQISWRDAFSIFCVLRLGDHNFQTRGLNEHDSFILVVGSQLGGTCAWAETIWSRRCTTHLTNMIETTDNHEGKNTIPRVSNVQLFKSDAHEPLPESILSFSCALQLGDQKSETRVVRGTSAPVFNEYFEMYVRDPLKERLEMRVRPWDTFQGSLMQIQRTQ